MFSLLLQKVTLFLQRGSSLERKATTPLKGARATYCLSTGSLRRGAQTIKNNRLIGEGPLRILCI